MINLSIPIRCGEKTCAESSGKFCRFVSARFDGSDPYCDLFHKPLTDTNGGIAGWLLRCEQCRSAEREVVGMK